MTTQAARLIVEVRWGRCAGVKRFLAPGGVLLVGRAAHAGLRLAHDERVADAHLEIGWDGERCSVRELDNGGGTTLDGEALRGVTVAEHGAWLRAGASNLTIHVEDHTPSGAPPLHGEVATQSVRTALRSASVVSPVYGVLDAARDDRVLQLLREHLEPHRSLFDGTEGDALETVAPYLVGPMDPSSALLDRLVREGWGRRWGVYLSSAAAPADIRRQLRRSLRVELESTGKSVYFRFYDPAVLRSFLAHGAPAERRAFAGEVLARASFEAADGSLRAHDFARTPPGTD